MTKLYVIAPNGQVHLRNTDNGYTYALVGMLNDKSKSWVCSWHARRDLAEKAQRRHFNQTRTISATYVRVVLNEAHGPCGHCDGTGFTPCSHCRGRVEYDWKKEHTERAPGPNQDRGWNGFYMPGWYCHWQTNEHFVCKCKTSKTPGKVKCHVCRGKGAL